jgi:serine protease Do
MPLVSDDDEAGTGAALPLVAWMESGNEIKDAAATIVAGSHRSVVRVTSGDDHRILGTILTADGWIVTKDSELRDSAACTLADGRKLYPERIVRDPLHDLAFLKVRASDLRPVGLVIDREYLPGEWVVCQGRDERPIGVGVVSVLPRQVGLTGGFLGVTLEDLTERGGIRVTRVIPDTAAALARIQPEDVILMLDGKAMSERTELIAGLSSRSPGSAVTLRILRGDREFEVPATLGARPNEPGETPEQRNTRRRVLSDRRTGFPQVLQHDTVLDPDQCGTPLIDVSGLCIGINIARESRLSTLAVPSSLVAAQLKWARGMDSGR